MLSMRWLGCGAEPIGVLQGGKHKFAAIVYMDIHLALIRKVQHCLCMHYSRSFAHTW